MARIASIFEDDIRRFLAPSHGSGYGYGYGSGSGSGSGYGDGDGYGYGSGSGYGDGDGSGYGDGDGLTEINGEAVYKIDGVQTIIRKLRGDTIAMGYIVNGDLTLTPCFVMKQEDMFAHGESLHAAREALLKKLFEDMPEEDRLRLFVSSHEAGKYYPNSDFFSWHNRLTGSCEMGRRQFAKDHGLDIETGSLTPEEFIILTQNAYGGGTIRKLKPYYKLN